MSIRLMRGIITPHKVKFFQVKVESGCPFVNVFLERIAFPGKRNLFLEINKDLVKMRLRFDDHERASFGRGESNHRNNRQRLNHKTRDYTEFTSQISIDLKFV